MHRWPKNRAPGDAATLTAVSFELRHMTLTWTARRRRTA
jgi:hypothetical protein